MITMGQKLMLTPVIFQADPMKPQLKKSEKKCKCTVVYIHPQGRYFVAEFRFPFGSFREAFLMGREDKL